MSARDSIARLLAAIESRDLRAIEDALAPEVTWQNVPTPPAIGRDSVLAMLADIVTWSDEVRWDVTTASHDDDTGWIERVDRFVIGGVEHAVRCNGVFDVHDGLVVGVRDYVDIAEWRSRIGPVLNELRGRPASDVVARHVAAVADLDPVGMTADYALDAVLVRADTSYRGWRAIAGYFDGVPERLAGRHLELAPPESTPDSEPDVEVVVRWSITGSASGTDRYEVRGGRIVRQVVELDDTDF